MRTIARETYNYILNPLEPVIIFNSEMVLMFHELVDFIHSWQIDPILTALYDSIMMYAEAVTQLWRRGEDFYNGTNIINLIMNSSFTGFEGSRIFIGADGQRDRDYDVFFFNNKTEQFEVGRILFLVTISLLSFTKQHQNHKTAGNMSV